MAAEILIHLLIANLAGAAAVGLVLALRRPARGAIGARGAYGLWLIVPVAMIASLAPARTVWHAAPAVVASQPAAWTAARLPNPAPLPVAAIPARAARADIGAWLVEGWMAGACVLALIIALGQYRALAAFGLIGADARGRARAANLACGPALVGLLRPRIVLPADFESRFAPGEQAMILAHEGAHLSAGHLWINAAVGAMRCLNWFNPLAHIGAFYARVDQELACDAAVMARHPDQRRTYAQAMLKTQLAAAPLPIGCYWPARSPRLIRERIEMLGQQTPGRFRLLAGAAGLGLLTLACGYAAWAAEPPVVKTAAAPADPLASLAADAGAILGVGSDPRLQITETANGVTATRTLAVGDEYRDGWTISAIAAGSVTLTKGKEARTVTLTGRVQLAVAATPPPAAPAKAAATNATTPPPRSAALAAAIAAGDVKGALALGATARDIATILQATGRNIDINTAAWVKDGSDSYALGYMSNPPYPQRGFYLSRFFGDYAPPGDVASLPTADEALGPTPPPPPTPAYMADVGQMILAGATPQDAAAVIIANRTPNGTNFNPATAYLTRNDDGSLSLHMSSDPVPSTSGNGTFSLSTTTLKIPGGEAYTGPTKSPGTPPVVRPAGNP